MRRRRRRRRSEGKWEGKGEGDEDEDDKDEEEIFEFTRRWKEQGYHPHSFSGGTTDRSP